MTKQKDVKIKAYLQKDCGPCKIVNKKTLPKLTKKYSVQKIDISKVPEQELDNLGVMGTPTFFIEHNGESRKIVGEYNLREFEKEIKKMTKK